MTPEAAFAACRFLHMAAATMLWGTFAYLSALVPARLSHPVAELLGPASRVAVALVAATALAALPLQTAMIGDGWPDALDTETLRDVVSATSVGKAWLVQVVPSILLIVVQFAPSRARSVLTAVISGLVLAGLVSAGHVFMQGGWLRMAHQLNDAVHVLSACGWVGALLPLLIILSMVNKRAPRPLVITSLHRFSRAGYVAVALAVSSGAINTLFMFGWPVTWHTRYGTMLLAKIGLVAAMILIAIINRCWFVPRIGRSGASAVAAISLGIIAEISLGLSALFLVSIFGMLDPSE